MWEVENKILTDKEVLEFIESKPHKLIVMSGPTQCGKTKIVKSIESEKIHIVRADDFSDFVYSMIKYDYTGYSERLLDVYKLFDYLIVEDVDLGAFMATHRLLDFIDEYVKISTLIFTGVEVCKWRALIDLHKKEKAIFVTYCEGEDEIEKL